MLDEAARKLVNHGRLRLREHALNHAEEDLRAVLARYPAYADAQRLLGITLVKLGRTAEGLASLRSATQREPGHIYAWWDLAVACRDNGQPQEAEAAIARAAALAAAAGRNGPQPLADEVFTVDAGRYGIKVVDYDYKIAVRYGAGRPVHPELQALISAGDARYAEMIARLGELQPSFAAIPLQGSYAATEPFWLNTWFPPLDGMALTEMLRAHNPAQFLEVGSGVSTKFARRAIAEHGLRTRITSIDPMPRNEIDALCDRIIRSPLEDVAAEEFAALEAGDILFVDSSHRAFQNSDVTAVFLEILPRLKPGVIVQVHDIYLPADYLAGQVARLWNEQYLLATALLFGPERFEVLFPCWHVTRDPVLSADLNARVRRGPLANLSLHGFSFWMRISRGPA